MPHYNIWVRAADDSIWKAVTNRSEWLHEKLSEGQRGIVKIKAKPGTVDPISGLEIDEFHMSSPKVLKLLDSLYEPKIIKTPKDVPTFNREDRQPIPKSFSARKKK